MWAKIGSVEEKRSLLIPVFQKFQGTLCRPRSFMLLLFPKARAHHKALDVLIIRSLILIKNLYRIDPLCIKIIVPQPFDILRIFILIPVNGIRCITEMTYLKAIIPIRRKQVQLSGHTGFIAGIPQQRGQIGVVFPKRPQILYHPCSRGIFPCFHGSPGWSTNRRRAIGIGKKNAVCCQGIQIGGQILFQRLLSQAG